MRVYDASQNIYRDMTEEEINDLSSSIEYIGLDYNERVNNLIREKYSLSEELSLLRQQDTKKKEYQEYYEFCELCKQKAKGIGV